MSTENKKGLRATGCEVRGIERTNRDPFFLAQVLFIFIMFIALSGYFCAANGGERKITFYNTDGQKTCGFNVELASTPEEQSRGLMFREKLPDNGGMLFLFNSDEMRYFWMKNTLIDLDLIFLSSKRRVVSVFHSARPMDETTISSLYPARYVLEVKAGRASLCGIKAGTQARFINIPASR